MVYRMRILFSCVLLDFPNWTQTRPWLVKKKLLVVLGPWSKLYPRFACLVHSWKSKVTNSWQELHALMKFMLNGFGQYCWVDIVVKSLDTIACGSLVFLDFFKKIIKLFRVIFMKFFSHNHTQQKKRFSCLLFCCSCLWESDWFIG